MTKSRKAVLLSGLAGKCILGHELARQLLIELDAYGPFTLTKSDRYRASNGQFAPLTLVQAWTVRQTIKRLASLPQQANPHALCEAHVAMKDDAPIRTMPTPGEQRHTARVLLWHGPTWYSEEDGQAQHDYIQTILA